MYRFLVAFIFITFHNLWGQNLNSIEISWKPSTKYMIGDNSYYLPQFDVDKMVVSPNYTLLFKTLLPESVTSYENIVLKNFKSSPMSLEDLGNIDTSKIPSEPQLRLLPIISSETTRYAIEFSPIIQNNNNFYKITQIEYQLLESTSSLSAKSKQGKRAVRSNSVLNEGKWLRFYVTKSGIYKISKKFLTQLGVPANTDPRTIQIYGNGGQMLPLINNPDFPIDLNENAVSFTGEEDGKWDDQDFIMMYAKGVENWNSESLTHTNLYDSKSYYYVTFGQRVGKRISAYIPPVSTATRFFSTFESVRFYEKDLVNLGNIGRKWLGENFDIQNNQSFDFEFSNLDSSSPLEVEIVAASASGGASFFNVKVNETDFGNINFSVLNPNFSIYAYENLKKINYNATSNKIKIQLQYNNGGVPSSRGYLDYIRIIAKEKLIAGSTSFEFLNPEANQQSGIGNYKIENAQAITAVWNITNYQEPTFLLHNQSAVFSYNFNMGIDKNWIAIGSTNFLDPQKENNPSVANQNIKKTVFLNSQNQEADVEYIIITPQSLVAEAELLAQHYNNQNLNTKVITTESIYHEFSSGKQDIAAIRNFLRYVYQNPIDVTKRLKYVNFFGDASFDYKNRIKNNSNIVPTFHAFYPNTVPSTSGTAINFSKFSTFMSDDFYCLMDDGEGRMTSLAGLDFAVGRMLVNNNLQAKEMVNKTLSYYTNNALGKWHNNYTIISDDADNITDATLQEGLDALADNLYENKPTVNVKKIHSDAYLQEVAAGGERYPSVDKDFVNTFDLGSLVFNYFGHGGEEGLAREQIFMKNDAQSLTNKNKLPLFITITCEFTRFDNPERETAGEYMFWNKNGGAVALVTTTREIGITTGFNMNSILTQYLYNTNNKSSKTIAEALMKTKNEILTDNRNVVFFIGDPALKLALPKPKIKLTHINGVPTSQATDTLKALSRIKLSGIITDENDQLINNYNGQVEVQVFDKNLNKKTLGNNGTVFSNGQLWIMDFETLGETIFRGNANVQNGLFQVEFIVPKDIKLPVGNGRVSFYAKRNNIYEDQTGFDNTLKIGGLNKNATADNIPPKVTLYMNTNTFINGSTTNNSPILLVEAEDESGINTASGVGHDLIAILDGDESKPFILNDYYETNKDDFTKGTIKFPFTNLSPGLHKISVKIWDVHNNLTITEITFVVSEGDELRIDKVLNYPNPFVSYTQFWFQHNRPFEPLEVQLQIFTVSGKLVKTINQTVVNDGFLSRDISWNGRDDFGNSLGKGVYIYKLNVKSTTTGKKVEKYEKLVIL